MSKARCYLCKENVIEVDFTDKELLLHYINESGKISSRRRTRLCAKHGRQVKRAVKRARNLGLLPFMIE